jgi:hypothetical protein
MSLVPLPHNFYSHSFNHFKMTVVQNSEVDAKGAPASTVLSRIKFGNNDKHTILVWQLKSYSESHIWTHCLTTVTMILSTDHELIPAGCKHP